MSHGPLDESRETRERLSPPHGPTSAGEEADFEPNPVPPGLSSALPNGVPTRGRRRAAIGGRQEHRDRGPFAELALDREMAAMPAQDVLDDRKAEAGAA